MAINFDKAFGIHEQALLLRAERAGILANNLANADTPNFKARDIDFQQVFKQAAGERRAHVLSTTHTGHIQTGNFGQSASAEILYRTPLQPSIDGNTVDAQIEQAAILKNGMQYQASLRFLTGRIKGLITAIRGD